MKTWQTLEENVKILSSFIWNCNAISETISGVKLDCVLKPEANYWVLVEITENNTINKVRTDIAKFSVCRPPLLAKNIYAKCYLITQNEPTDAMIMAGNDNFVEVLSYMSFSKIFLDYESYKYNRSQKSFGSSVNPFSGAPDNYAYTPVFYQDIKSKKDIQLKDIRRNLLKGKNIILLGNYGTGKSRCIRELFFSFSAEYVNNLQFPIAINLKENWGTQRADEVIRRHFGMLGLTKLADSAIKVLEKDKLIFLLDGFDEVGTQIWSNDSTKLKQIRASSLKAIKHLVETTKSPIIITGREHYFNTNKEMFDALGLDPLFTEVYRCKDEFTNEQMEDYLKNLSLIIDLPRWLPKRPIICQIINSIEKEQVESIFLDTDSSVEFWHTLVKNICDREARIAPILGSDSIFSILKAIARITRTKPDNVGPLSVHEINSAFESIIKTPPVDESAVMLQRLPGLGRVSSENTDRQFIDFYILDGLRADNLIDIVYNDLDCALDEKWVNSLKNTGIEIVAKRITNDKSANAFITYLKKAKDCNNNVLSGDLIAVLAFYATNNILDFNGIIIENSSISMLNLSNSLIDNIIFKNIYIEDLDISTNSFSKIIFDDCIINKIYGIKNEKEIPPFIRGSLIEHYEVQPMSPCVCNNMISQSHMVLISLLKKLFFLGNIQRTIEDLIKGFSSKKDQIISKKVLKILLRYKLISESKSLVSSKSFERKRAQSIIEKLDKSVDDIWKEVEALN
jgi:hypothetical protein